MTTLPKEYQGVKQIMQAARAPLEAPAFADYLGKFEYGASPRLSRHARKRITEMLERDTFKNLGVPRL